MLIDNSAIKKEMKELEQEINNLEKIDLEELKELKSALIEVLENALESLRFQHVEKYIEEKNAVTEAKVAELGRKMKELSEQVIRLENNQKNLDTQVISTYQVSIEEQFEKQSHQLKKIFKRVKFGMVYP